MKTYRTSILYWPTCDNVPLTAGQDALAKRLKGECYYLRAFEYATLLMVHGGVVLSSYSYLNLAVIFPR
jgi:hypothetical protein